MSYDKNSGKSFKQWLSEKKSGTTVLKEPKVRPKAKPKAKRKPKAKK